MDRLIVVLFLATILVISRVFRYPSGACQWVFIAWLYPWHPLCFPCFPHCCLAYDTPA